MLNRCFPILLVLLVCFLGMRCSKPEQAKPESPAADPPVEKPVSDNIQFIRWTPDLNVPDPVSISLDPQGRAYVTQTQRRKSQDLDIRNNRDWIPEDVGLDSVEAKRQFLRTQLAPEHSEANRERVADHNGDGSHDWRDLTAISERIHLVEDTDGDGFADQSQLFAEGFKSEVTGIAAGVLWHEGDVYATIAPDVWKLRDTDGDDQADDREILATGFGLHIAYAGHDMHGLTVGPDGKLYWSIGDKGIHVTSREGKRFYYPNQGGVLRCNPDGSDFEVFAHGLRNVQEFAFDAFGNWFGVDNDSDQPGEKERFVYIVDGMDAGWRCNFQYRGEGYNPWIDENLTLPAHEGQAAYILPTLKNYVDGPAGFVWNPGTALNDRYKDYFFLNGTLNGAQYAFQVEPDGAAFRMINDHKIGEGIPLIGLTVGPDGALYSVDWGGDYPLNQTGAIWKLDTPGANLVKRREVQELLQKGMGGFEVPRLRTFLNHEDQRIRLQAQFELVKRQATAPLIEDATQGPLLQRIHAIWGLGQRARQEDAGAIQHLQTLLTDSETEVQVQAAKVLSDLKPGAFEPNILIPLLTASHPRVRFQAGLSLGRHPIEEAFEAVVSLIEENDGQDRYLRHAGIRALEGIGKADTLSTHSAEEVRLCAVVALRRQGDPSVADFLNDTSQQVVTEAARAIHDDLSIPETLPTLANRIVGIDYQDEALIRRIINANFRLGTPNHAYVVAEYAANDTHPLTLRLEALQALESWIDPPLLDRVDGRRRELDYRPANEIANAVKGNLERLLDSDNPRLLESAISAANQLSVVLSTSTLEELLENRKAPSSLRILALQRLRDPKTVTYALNSLDPDLRIAAADFLAQINTPKAIDYLSTRLERSSSLEEKQKAIAMLAEFSAPEADVHLQTYARMLTEDYVPPGLQLDIIEAAKKRNLTEELEAFDRNRPADTAISDYIETLYGGDPEAGAAITQNHLAAQCARCHQFETGEGSNIGPSLNRIGSERSREYLLRSLVEPGADIAPGFGMTTVVLKSGAVVTGHMGDEKAEGLEVILADGSVKQVDRSDIQSQTPPISSMPPMGNILTKRELRDVVAYLSSLEGGS